MNFSNQVLLEYKLQLIRYLFKIPKVISASNSRYSDANKVEFKIFLSLKVPQQMNEHDIWWSYQC